MGPHAQNSVEYWTEAGLSRLASAIGIPLYADHATESRKRISFARVCVEIEATRPLIDEFTLDILSQEDPTKIADSIPIRVTYQWKPQVCTYCKLFGHLTENCRNHVSVNEFPNSANSQAKGHTSSQVSKGNSTWRIARRRGRAPAAPSSGSAPPTSSNPFDALSTDIDSQEPTPSVICLANGHGTNQEASSEITSQLAAITQSKASSSQPAVLQNSDQPATSGYSDVGGLPAVSVPMLSDTSISPVVRDLSAASLPASTVSERGKGLTSDAIIPVSQASISPSERVDGSAPDPIIPSPSESPLAPERGEGITPDASIASITSFPEPHCSHIQVSSPTSSESISPELSSWASKIKSIDGTLLTRLSSADFPVLHEQLDTSKQAEKNTKQGKQGMGRYKNSRSK